MKAFKISALEEAATCTSRKKLMTAFLGDHMGVICINFVERGRIVMEEQYCLSFDSVSYEQNGSGYTQWTSNCITITQQCMLYRSEDWPPGVEIGAPTPIQSRTGVVGLDQLKYI
ncbi:hypothetical protein AVEN_10902-1 [Araneus ventricosus]|uniref:Uncharacterized protein n=1 Tax=Araneus ventricosus TaxID=182803 RepID=A0A4Y2F9C5_ARAVE|nr:hypothetical protein AVEN_10902-1 [Araneus ventricosus]